MNRSRIAFGFTVALVAAIGSAVASAATPSISAGANHAISIDAGGTVRAWGSDDHGQLGLGRKLVNPVPATVKGAPRFTDLSSYTGTVLGLTEDGGVWSWGENGLGQLGDGTTTSRSVPARIAGLPPAKAVATGDLFSLALARDGSVWSWGVNWSGQLGTVSPFSSLVPVRIEVLSEVVAIAAGASHALALRSDGSVWSWGSNATFQLGDGTTTNRPTPIRLASLSGVALIAASNFHSVAARTDGTVWTWGANDSGQLGDGTMVARAEPVQAVGVSGVTAVSAGNKNTLALKSDGTVWVWGTNDWGQLGVRSSGPRLMGAPVPGVAAIVKISMSPETHVVTVDGDGRLHLWGWNVFGQLGDGTTGNPQLPIVLASPSGIDTRAGRRTVVAAAGHTLAIDASGQAWAWGANYSGQLADGTATSRSAPTRVEGITDAVAVSAGDGRSLALRSGGTVLTWGDVNLPVSTPTLVSGLSDVVEISAGGSHNLARKQDGTVAAWGGGAFGQLGDGTTTYVSGRAVAVTGLTNVTAVSAGDAHSAALTADRRVWTWGRNGNGQLGDGTTTDRSTPAPVPGLGDVIAIAAGSWHTLALRSDGSVWGWGANGFGQLADGSSRDRLVPAPIVGIRDAMAISAGRIHSLAVLRDGTLRAWSWNGGGNLGDGTFDFGDRIAAVAGFAGATKISAGGGYYGTSLAMKPDATVWSWGWNSIGALGDGTFVNRASPVVVIGEGGGGSLARNDWYLDLDPSIVKTIPPEKVPVFLVLASAAGSAVTAYIQFRSQDLGTTGSVFVFAYAPASSVKDASTTQGAGFGLKAKTVDGKDTAVACVLAQLNSAGQLVAVSAAQMQAFMSGVLSAQGASVNIFSGVPPVNIGGTTFFVGYGTSGGAMIGTGTNRGVVTVPGANTCQPQAPQKGWWWNPLEDGRGFSVEVRGNNLFFASFLYDVSGRSTWYVSTGPVSLDGSFYSGDLLSASGGQTLGGPYVRSPTLRTEGNVTLAFNSATQGTMIWPGGTVPIQRFNIVQNGITLPAAANIPESGWWWNESEAGRGFFMEWQGKTLDIAGYMYDDQGNSVWYLTVGEMSTNNQAFSGNWWSYGNGQTLTGAWKPNARLSTTVAPLSITFSGPNTALMTLPNGRSTALTRFRF